MQSLSIAWNFLSLASIFVFPQLLGILLYLRLSRAPRWVAAIVGVLAPVILFVLLAPIFLFAGLRETYADGPECGMPALGALMVLFTGTIIQLVLGLAAQLILRASRRH